MQPTRTYKRKPIADRLRKKLVLMPNGCLEFTGARQPSGYGKIGGGGTYGRTELAHRVAWELANGPIPEGLDVCHHCDNPPCVQTEPTEGFPDGHLFLGTRSENLLDAVAKRRQHWSSRSHCPQGHPYDEENTYRRPSRGGRSRECRACNLAEGRRLRKERKALLAQQ